MSTQKKIIVAVLGLAINKHNQFLLTRRHAPGSKVWHNKWQAAGGGLEFGETPEQALAREMQEELGVSIRILHPYPIVKSSVWYASETSSKSDSQIILMGYIVDIGQQRIDISKDNETNAFEWYTLEDVLKLDCLPMTPEIITEAAKMCNQYSLRDMLQ